MQYIFYVDVYFFQNVLMKIGVLYFVMKTIKLRVRRPVIRILTIAVLGTIFEIAGLFLFTDYEWYTASMHLMVIPAMVMGLLWGYREAWWKGSVMGYMGAIVTNGVIEILWNCAGSAWIYPGIVFVAIILLCVGVYYVLRYLRMQRGIYPVDILRPDIIWTVNGFYDSGNCLQDKATGKGVHIISTSLAKKLELDVRKAQTIGCQSLGNNSGTLQLYYVEELVIRRSEGKVRMENVPLGVAGDELFRGKNYEMIINSEIIP